jgi:hypothetical protein
MTPGSELRKLKSDLSSFECLNIEDIKFYTDKISRHIYYISEHHPVADELLKSYIDCVVLKHIEIIEDFVHNAEAFKGKEEFITKALKYHFNCIIDSYTYATVAYQH